MEYQNPYIQKISSVDKDNKYGNKAGIYAIKVMGQIVYIGKSSKLLERVAAHMQHIIDLPLESHKYKVLRQAYKENLPIEFDVLYYCQKIGEEMFEDLGEVEGLFIRHYKPLLNYQIPKADNWRKYITNKHAQEVTLDEIKHLAKKGE